MFLSHESVQVLMNLCNSKFDSHRIIYIWQQSYDITTRNMENFMLLTYLHKGIV